MKLSRLERLMLSNQYRILEKLYPDEADGYEKARLVLERGYTLHYSWQMDHIEDEIAEGDCREVLDILEMYRVLTDSYNNLEDKSGLDETKVRFPGFDGNNEAALLGYVRYLIRTDGRYEELDRPEGFNSHVPMLQRYRLMLDKWKGGGQKQSLSKNSILDILGIEETVEN